MQEIKGRPGSDSVQFRHNKLGLLFGKFSKLAFVVRIFFGALNLSFLFVEGKHAYFKPKKPASHRAEIDSHHGNYLDPGICIGFLSHSIFGISIRHHQQLSRYVSWPRSLFHFECTRQYRHKFLGKTRTVIPYFTIAGVLHNV